MFHIFLHCYYFRQIEHRRNNSLLNFFQCLNKILPALAGLILLIDYFYFVLFRCLRMVLQGFVEESDKILGYLLKEYLMGF